MAGVRSGIWGLLRSKLAMALVVACAVALVEEPVASLHQRHGIEVDQLAELALFESVPQGSKVSLMQITLQPGETFNFKAVPYAAIVVESGRLEFTMLPGLSFQSRSMSGGSIAVDADGRATIGPGQALVAEDAPVGAVANPGDRPAILLAVFVSPAEIDPATGQPVLDGATAARIANRERERLREACEDGAVGTPSAEVSATPVPGERVPKACRR